MKFNKIENLNNYHLYYDDINDKNEIVEKNIVNTFKKDPYNIIDVFVEILNNKLYDDENDVDVFDEKNNEIIIYDIDEFDVDEFIDDLFDYEIVKYDPYYHEIFIKIDDDEFIKKSFIESYDELLKYYKHDIFIDDLIENSNEYKYIYNRSIGTNLLNDYYYKNCYLYKEFINLYSLNSNDDYIDLLIKFKKIVDDEFIDNIEILLSIDNLYENIESYDDYDVELYNEYHVIIDHDKKIIKNIDDPYEFILNIISSYFNLNNKFVFYDELIELYKIINDDIDYVVDYDNIIELFDINDVVEFIENDIEYDYDLYNYDKFVELNDLFYNVFKKYHNKK